MTTPQPITLQIKIVGAANGWQWIAGGMQLFKRAPLQWFMLLSALFLVSRALLFLPMLGILAMLVTPVFLAGLMHGAQDVIAGKPLRFAHLISGFLHQGAALVTLGGLSLLSQFLILLIMGAVGGDDVANLMQTMSDTGATPEALEAAAPKLLQAMLVGLALSVPVMMALWFAPLLVYFDNVKPIGALIISFRACAVNFAPFLIYGLAFVAPALLLSPLAAVSGQPDLILWLLMPALIPSIYTSYRDLFIHKD